MRKVLVLMLLFLANAQQRRLNSITCDVPCKADEFKADPLVVLCGGGLCTTSVTLRKGKSENVISLPVGTQGVELRMEANDDMDINLLDAADSTCIAGALCQDSSFEAVEGCSSSQDYCLPYQNMSWYFSGDEEDNPVVETLRLSPGGSVTVPLRVSLQAASNSIAQVSATNAAFDECPEQLPGCRSCSEFTGCSNLEMPMCDGSAVVVCAPPTTTSSTGTSITTTSSSATTTSMTSTSISLTTTTTKTFTSTTRSSTKSTSSTTKSSTVTSITRSTTTRSSSTTSGTTTSLTSLTSTSTSTMESKTSSSTTTISSSSSTVSATESSTTSGTRSSTSSSSFTRTSTTTSTGSSSSSSVTTSSTSETSVTSTSSSTSTSTTSSFTTSSLTTSSTTRSSSITSSTTSTTLTMTTVTSSTSITTTISFSSTSISVTSTSSSITSTSITHSTTVTSLTSSSTSTSATTTTSSVTETSSSSSITSTSSSSSSTATCGCCSDCLGWAMMTLGCGSIAVCQGQLEETRAALATCQGNSQGYQIGLEECRSREAVLSATIDSLRAQLGAANCTSVLADDETDTTAIWVLLALVILLLLALILLLLLCWRLRGKHQMAKEQLSHCQDELFTRPQLAKQDESSELQQKLRKLQRDLDDANAKLAAKVQVELKLQQLQERLGKEQENVKRGQELWKLNKSMYTILRQVVQDSREFAQGVREAGEKAPVFKQRIEQFEAKLAITSGRREAAEAELAILKNEAPLQAGGQPSEGDTTCDGDSPISISTGLGRRGRSKDSKELPTAAEATSATPAEVPPMESPRLVVQVEENGPPPDPPKVDPGAFTSVAPMGPAGGSTIFAPKERTVRGTSRQESRIEEVLAQRLELSPGTLREGLRRMNSRQVGPQAKQRTMVLERVFSKRLDEAKVMPSESNEIPMEPMTSQSSQQ